MFLRKLLLVITIVVSCLGTNFSQTKISSSSSNQTTSTDTFDLDWLKEPTINKKTEKKEKIKITTESVTNTSLEKSTTTIKKSKKVKKINTNAPYTEKKSVLIKEKEPVISEKEIITNTEPIKTEKKHIISEKQFEHTVIKGDTLWDIADKYYNNPWLWKKIWNANRTIINNPDLIYPEQVFIIPQIEKKIIQQVKTEEIVTKSTEQKTFNNSQEEKKGIKEATISETEKTPVIMEAETKKQIISTEPKIQEKEKTEQTEETKSEQETVPETTEETLTEQETVIVEEKLAPVSSKELVEEKPNKFVIPVDFEFDGIITGFKEQKYLITQHDIVYLTITNNKLKQNSICGIYRKIGTVKDTKTGKVLGYRITKVGKLRLNSEVSNNLASSIIIRSYEIIRTGDLILAEK
jgi:hypothetical protein